MKEITIKDIRKWKAEISKNNIPSRQVTFNEPQGHIGNGIYRIADGVLCGKEGWDEYLKLFKEAGYKDLNNNDESKPDSNNI